MDSALNCRIPTGTTAVENNRAPRDPHKTFDNASECDDDQILPLEYARRYGLTTSHLHDPYDAVDSPPSPAILRADLEDPISTSSIGDTITKRVLAKFSAGDKWDVDRATATFLASVAALGKDDLGLNPQQIDRPVHLSDLKVEEAILASDPDMDRWQLKNRNKVTISGKGMPQFDLNDSKGESFAWSVRELQAYADAEDLIINQKFDVDVETSTYLKKEIVGLNRQNLEEAVIACLDARTGRSQGTITPPLLPMSPSFSPAEPSTSAMEMELTSTPDDLTAKEAAQIEQQILEDHDDLIPPPPFTPSLSAVDASAEAKETHDLLCTPQNGSFSPRQFRRLQDFRLDAPLIPDEELKSPAKKSKTVSFPAEPDTMIPTPNVDVFASDLDQADESFLREVVKPLAGPAIRQAQNEPLVEFDTTLRVTVPNIEYIELNPPWIDADSKGSTTISLKRILSSMNACVPEDERKCSGVSNVERLLPWTPFPTRLARVQLDETFDDGSLARYMAAMSVEDHVHVEDLVWKPEGLRVLDTEESDEDELEKLTSEAGDELVENHQDSMPNCGTALPPQVPDVVVPNKTDSGSSRHPRMDMQTLLIKRKLELEGDDHANGFSKRPDRGKTMLSQRHGIIGNPGQSGALEDIGGLSRFMQLHGERANDVNVSSEQPVSTVRQSPPRAGVALPEISTEEYLTQGPAIAAPDVQNIQAPASIVLSANLSANRELIREISRLLPRIDMVERESTSALDSSNHRASKQANKYEADITLLPGSGLILTTLQKLKQKALPGQSSYFGVRERVQNVAVRYERLLVLVSEGRQSVDGQPATAGPLDETDSEALSDLITFGTAMTTDVEVYYVAGGGSELVQWVAALVCRHATTNIDMKLLHDETIWERFLRHAGLDAYAAQMVLSQLKRSEDHLTKGSSSAVGSCNVPAYGLAAFVQMTAEQRMEQFAPLMAGERVLRRVNGSIDRPWLSASTPKH